MALPDNVMMKRVHHVSGKPDGGMLTYTIDANQAVREFPDQWSHQPWPEPKPHEPVRALASAPTPVDVDLTFDPTPPDRTAKARAASLAARAARKEAGDTE